MIKETPISIDRQPVLAPTRSFISGSTNPNMIKELPITMNNVQLTSNHPRASVMTNFAAPSLSGYNPKSVSFDRLAERTHRGGFTNDGIRQRRIPTIPNSL
jgi:hypothetical protein